MPKQGLELCTLQSLRSSRYRLYTPGPRLQPHHTEIVHLHNLCLAEFKTQLNIGWGLWTCVYLGQKKRIWFVHFSQSIQHLWKFWRIHWFHCDFSNRLTVEFQRPKYLCLKTDTTGAQVRPWLLPTNYFIGAHASNILTSSHPLIWVMVAVLVMVWSTPSIRTQFPAGTRFTSIVYLVKYKSWPCLQSSSALLHLLPHSEAYK